MLKICCISSCTCSAGKSVLWVFRGSVLFLFVSCSSASVLSVLWVCWWCLTPLLSLFFAAEDLWNAVKTPTAPQPQADHRRDCLHPKEVHPRQVAIDLCSSGCLKCSCFGLNILQTTPRPKRFGGIGDWEPQEQVEGGEKVLVFGVARSLVCVK